MQTLNSTRYHFKFKDGRWLCLDQHRMGILTITGIGDTPQQAFRDCCEVRAYAERLEAELVTSVT